MLVDEFCETERVWASVSQWVADWFAECRANEYGDACAFISKATEAAVPGVVDALIVLADAAASAQELALVGAGPLEDLVSHSGNGLSALDEVERAARQNLQFRAALHSTWISSDVAAPVRARLAVLGAQLIDS